MYTVNTQASIATMLAAYNEVAPKARKSFKDKTAAAAALTKLGLDTVANSDLADQVLTEVDDNAAKTPGKKTDLSTAVINVIPGAANPSRPRTTRHARYEILRNLDGQTVSDYYRACREQGVPCNMKSPRIAQQKGFITLTKADGTPYVFTQEDTTEAA